MKWTRSDYVISDDPNDADPAAIRAMLSKTYWAAQRPQEKIEQSIRHSLAFHLFHQGKQIGLARAITDRCVLTLVCDVVIHEEHRGKGLGKWLMECLLSHPDIAPTRKYLFTKDAQGLYRQCGFEEHPYDAMIKWEPGHEKRD